MVDGSWAYRVDVHHDQVAEEHPQEVVVDWTRVADMALGALIATAVGMLADLWRSRRGRRLARLDRARDLLRPVREAMCALRARWDEVDPPGLSQAELALITAVERCAAELRAEFGCPQLRAVDWQLRQYQKASVDKDTKRQWVELELLQRLIDHYDPETPDV